MDIQTGKISNQLIVFGLWMGYIRNLAEYGWNGSFYFLIRIFVPILFFYLLFLMHALGAGDIKLFSVISSCIGIHSLLKVITFSFLAGAVLSLLILLHNKNLFTRLSYFFHYCKIILITKTIVKYDYQSDGKQNLIHFSVAILIGYCLGGA